MDTILSFFLIFLSLIIGFVVRHLLTSYFSEKGKNLATKEDIAEITKKIEEVKMEFSNRSHALVKKRETYEKICKSMQVFVVGQPQNQTKKNEMLEAYSTAWLWANDDVLKKLNEHINLQLKNSSCPGSVTQAELKESYIKCILEIRKDSGYSNTNQKLSDFQFISFKP